MSRQVGTKNIAQSVRAAFKRVTTPDPITGICRVNLADKIAENLEDHFVDTMRMLKGYISPMDLLALDDDGDASDSVFRIHLVEPDGNLIELENQNVVSISAPVERVVKDIDA